jgi:hypothetical protein
MPFRQHQLGMPTRNNQAEVGKGDGHFRLGQKRRVEMPLQVMDAHERASEGEGEGFCGSQPHHQRAHQPRTVRDGDAVDFAQGDARLLECLLQKGVQPLHMLARRRFRHNATPACMQVRLGRYKAAAHAPLLQHRYRRLIATGLDAQNQVHMEIILLPFRAGRDATLPPAAQARNCCVPAGRSAAGLKGVPVCAPSPNRA